MEESLGILLSLESKEKRNQFFPCFEKKKERNVKLFSPVLPVLFLLREIERGKLFGAVGADLKENI